MPLYTTIRENGGWGSFQILPIEEFECNNKIQAVIREQKYIDELKPNLNINRAFTGIVDNNNYNKQYKEMFREELLLKKLEYYQNNKDKINEKCLCECGKHFTHNHKSRHQRSKRHINFLSANCNEDGQKFSSEKLEGDIGGDIPKRTEE